MPLPELIFDPIYAKNITQGKLWNDRLSPNETWIIIYDDNLPSVNPPIPPENFEDIYLYDPDEYLNNPNRKYHLTIEDLTCREIVEIHSNPETGGERAYELDGKKYIKVKRRQQDTDNNYVRGKIWEKDAPIKIRVTAETFNSLIETTKNNYLISKRIIENDINHDSLSIESTSNYYNPSLLIKDNFTSSNKERQTFIIDSKFENEFYNKLGPVRFLYGTYSRFENDIYKAFESELIQYVNTQGSLKIGTDIRIHSTKLNDIIHENSLEPIFEITKYGGIKIGNTEDYNYLEGELIHILGRSSKNGTKLSYGKDSKIRPSIMFTDETQSGLYVYDIFLENNSSSFIIDKESNYNNNFINFKLTKDSGIFIKNNIYLNFKNNEGFGFKLEEDSIEFGYINDFSNMTNNLEFQEYLDSIRHTGYVTNDILNDLYKNFITNWERLEFKGIPVTSNCYEGPIGHSKQDGSENDNIIPYPARMSEVVVAKSDYGEQIRLSPSSIKALEVLGEGSIDPNTPVGENIVYIIDEFNSFNKLNTITGNTEFIASINRNISDITFKEDGSLYASTIPDSENKTFLLKLNHVNGEIEDIGRIYHKTDGLVTDNYNQIWGIGDRELFKLNILENKDLEFSGQNKVEIEIVHRFDLDILPGLAFKSSENKIFIRSGLKLYKFDVETKKLDQYINGIGLDFEGSSTLEMIKNKLFLFTADGKVGIINQETGTGSWRNITFGNDTPSNKKSNVACSYWKYLPLNLTGDTINEKLRFDGGIFVNGYISGGFRTLNIESDGVLRWYDKEYGWENYNLFQDEFSEYNKSLFASNLIGVLDTTTGQHFLELEGNLRVETIASKNRFKIDSYISPDYEGYDITEDGTPISYIKIGMGKGSPNLVTKWGRFDDNTLQEVVTLSVGNKDNGLTFWKNTPYIQETDSDGNLLWKDSFKTVPVWESKNIPVTTLTANKEGSVFIKGTGIRLGEDGTEPWWSFEKLLYRRTKYSSLKWFNDHVKWNLSPTGESYTEISFDDEGEEIVSKFPKPSPLSKGNFYWWEGDHRWNFELTKVVDEPGIIREFEWYGLSKNDFTQTEGSVTTWEDDTYDIGEHKYQTIRSKSPIAMHKMLKLTGSKEDIEYDRDIWSSISNWYLFQSVSSVDNPDNEIVSKSNTIWNISHFDFSAHNSLPNELENRVGWYSSDDYRNVDYGKPQKLNINDKDPLTNEERHNYQSLSRYRKLPNPKDIFTKSHRWTPYGSLMFQSENFEVYRNADTTFNKFSFGDKVSLSFFKGNSSREVLPNSHPNRYSIMPDWYKELYDENEPVAYNSECARIITRNEFDSEKGTSVDFSLFSNYKKYESVTPGTLIDPEKDKISQLSIGVFSEKELDHLDESIGVRYASKYKNIHNTRQMFGYMSTFTNTPLNISVGGTDSKNIVLGNINWKSFYKSWPVDPPQINDPAFSTTSEGNEHLYDPSCSALLMKKEKYSYYQTEEKLSGLNWFASVYVPSLSSMKYGGSDKFDPNDPRTVGMWKSKAEAEADGITVPNEKIWTYLDNKYDIDMETQFLEVIWKRDGEEWLRNGKFMLGRNKFDFGRVPLNGESDVEYFFLNHATPHTIQAEITMSNYEDFEFVVPPGPIPSNTGWSKTSNDEGKPEVVEMVIGTNEHLNIKDRYTYGQTDGKVEKIVTTKGDLKEKELYIPNFYNQVTEYNYVEDVYSVGEKALIVDIYPESIRDKAYWFVNKGELYQHGDLMWLDEELESITIKLLPVEGYINQPDEILDLNQEEGNIIRVTINFTNKTGYLKVLFYPENIREPEDDRKRAAWYTNSLIYPTETGWVEPPKLHGEIVELPVGEHELILRKIPDYSEPIDSEFVNVEINEGEINVHEVNYDELGSLRVFIDPEFVRSKIFWTLEGGRIFNNRSLGFDTEPVVGDIVGYNSLTVNISNAYGDNYSITWNLIKKNPVSAGDVHFHMNPGSTISGLTDGEYTINFNIKTTWDFNGFTNFKNYYHQNPVTISISDGIEHIEEFDGNAIYNGFIN